MITWVDDSASLEAMVAAMAAADVVGVDSEWMVRVRVRVRGRVTLTLTLSLAITLTLTLALALALTR